jgi:hypothetical protein
MTATATSSEPAPNGRQAAVSRELAQTTKLRAFSFVFFFIFFSIFAPPRAHRDHEA